MARYIDAEKLKDDIAVLFERNEKQIDDFLANCVDDLIDAPTADVVEVVRCKECIFSKRDMDVHPDPKILNKDRWCELYGRKSPNWFCADGERREDV